MKRALDNRRELSGSRRCTTQPRRRDPGRLLGKPTLRASITYRCRRAPPGARCAAGVDLRRCPRRRRSRGERGHPLRRHRRARGLRGRVGRARDGRGKARGALTRSERARRDHHERDPPRAERRQPSASRSTGMRGRWIRAAPAFSVTGVTREGQLLSLAHLPTARTPLRDGRRGPTGAVVHEASGHAARGIAPPRQGRGRPR